MSNHLQLKPFLDQASIMQIATARDNNPWVVNLFFVVDKHYNFYWLSLPDRRHSQEISHNPHAALTVALKQDLPVIGVYAEGLVEVIRDQKQVKKIAEKYTQKYDTAHSFYDRFVAGVNQHWLYRLRPQSLSLFDEVSDPENPVKKIITEGEII